jgi:flagellar biosynthesis/type III secretory pathway protein FliH
MESARDLLRRIGSHAEVSECTTTIHIDAIKLIEADRAAIREEYAGLVERAYRKGYDDGFEDGCSDTPATATQMKAAIAALEGKVSQ